MKLDSKISIIIPVYNVAPYLDECLASVCRQTYPNIEILLIDDGSTDDSGNKCDEWSKKDARIAVFHKRNGGLSDARNYGIERCTGDYVTFIDSDDVVDEKIVHYLYELAREEDADIAICDPVHWYGDGEPKFSDETKRARYCSEEAICEMLYQNSFLVSAWGKIFKKECVCNVEFPVGILFEDSATTYRFFERAERIIYGNARYYAYRHRDSSITASKFSKKDLDIWPICNKISKKYEFDKTINKAAKSYQLSAAFRIILNSPNTAEYAPIRSECERWIGENYRDISSDGRVRKKAKLALKLYKYARPLLKEIYKHINRWE